VRIDSHTKTVSVDEKELALSSSEFDLVWQLASNTGIVVSREELISRLRGLDYDGLDRSIDNRISRLRKKINNLHDCPIRIKTIWGKGYLFVSDIQ